MADPLNAEQIVAAVPETVPLAQVQHLLRDLGIPQQVLEQLHTVRVDPRAITLEVWLTGVPRAPTLVLELPLVND